MPKILEFHPAANVFPLMSGDSFARLVADIDARGLLEPIVLHPDGTVLDGRNRYRACCELGIEPASCEWDGAVGDEIADVLSWNLHRRHLNESQRAMVASNVATLRDGQHHAEGAQICAPPSQPEAADMLSVSRRSVQSARRVQEQGTPELVDAVNSGTIAVSAAAGLAKHDHETQRAALGRVEAGTARNIPQALRQVDEAQRIEAAPDALPTNCRIECANAASFLSNMTERPHCVVMDPPYGLDTHRTREGGKDYEDGDHAVGLLRDVCARLSSVLADDAHLYVFSGYSNAHEFKTVLGEFFEVQDNPIIWAKNNHTMCDFAKWYPSKHEYIWFAKMRGGGRKLSRCVPDVIEFPRANATTHSAEKPVGLLQLLIEQSTERGELVCDPFLGSGSTALAALTSGRSFVGCELEPRWVEVSRARVS